MRELNHYNVLLSYQRTDQAQSYNKHISTHTNQDQ